MNRLNLTLDDDTNLRLERCAKKGGRKRAALARELLKEGLARRERLERQKKLAEDYAAERADAREILREMEATQFELLSDE